MLATPIECGRVKVDGAAGLVSIPIRDDLLLNG